MMKKGKNIMMKKVVLSLGAILALGSFSVAGGVIAPAGAPSAWGLTLPEALLHVINTNPEIRERIENYRAVEQDRTIAFAGNLPVVDVQAGIGSMRYGSDSSANASPNAGEDWTHTEAFIRARQNIFHGFGTEADIEQQERRLQAAKHYIMEKVSQLGLDMAEKFIAILKAQKILKLSIENHAVHKEYYSKIKDRTESGAGSQGDMDQISGRVALSQSNVIVAHNNLLDAETNFLRIYGYGQLSSPIKLRETKVKTSLIPGTLDQAQEVAERQYPSFLAVQKNVEALHSAHKQSQENYYPWVDLELKQSYYDNDVNNIAGEVDQTTLMVVATWNLYNGGADDALVEKTAARMYEESDRMLNTKRLVTERLRLSWAAKERIAEQLGYLRQHRNYSKKTHETYNEEFTLGRRTLLDLLDVKNEYFLSRKAYITAQYDQKLAKYRVIENVGNLPDIVSFTSDDMIKFRRHRHNQ